MNKLYLNGKNECLMRNIKKKWEGDVKKKELMRSVVCMWRREKMCAM